MFVGVGASQVRDLLEQEEERACIIFIDEIDAVGRHRGAGLGGGHDECEQTLNVLLVEMDGFESNEGVILIAATNWPDVDPALLRLAAWTGERCRTAGREGLRRNPSRTPAKPIVTTGPPDHRAYRGISGADLESQANEVALWAARQNQIHMGDFEMAKDKVLMGVERKSLILSGEEKKIPRTTKRDTRWLRQ